MANGFLGIFLALLLHNIPTIILLIVLIISWKREIIGAVAFVLVGIIYASAIVFISLKNSFEWYYLLWVLQVSGIAFLVGILFYFQIWFNNFKI